ncbi:MAG: TetR/AcrR family transcriptional regulator [Actinobacteria bacterium]|nr:TetR/AcrR family transcriptional regulator [Actinomycetota bacterium]
MADENRTKILDLAIAAIDAGGEAAVRVNHIVEEAGVTPPVLYYHFGNRDGLVIAAQIERYSRQIRQDIEAIGQRVSQCQTREELQTALVDVWEKTLVVREESRWRRVSVVGSAFARPELEAEVLRAQDEIVAGLVAVLQPCNERGWLREGIDLPSAVAWQHGLLLSRVFIERGAQQGETDEWDQLTLESLQHAFFGS